MDRMKTFFKYAMWLVLFFIFSEILIYVGLNSSYRDMQGINDIKQVEITQAQSTLVNGRMSGKITWDAESEITSKFVRVDFYSERNIKVGTRYIEINANEANKEQSFNIYFELQGIRTYKVSIVDEKETDEIRIFPKEMSRKDIFIMVFLTKLMFF